MQPAVRARLVRTTVLLGVFTAGLVAGSLHSPRDARAQSGEYARRATLTFISASVIRTGGERPLPSNCEDVQVIPGEGALSDGVLVLCERR